MSSLLTTLGLRATSPGASIPNLTSHYMIFNFVFAYAVLAPRHLKQIWGFDHNESPREDTRTYGEEAVKSGKITRSQLNMLKRNEAAQANAVEHFPFFIGAMLWANQTGVATDVINTSALFYTIVRAGYGASYVFIEDWKKSLIRSVFWWAGNIVCMRLFWLGGKVVNKSLP